MYLALRKRKLPVHIIALQGIYKGFRILRPHSDLVF